MTSATGTRVAARRPASDKRRVVYINHSYHPRIFFAAISAWNRSNLLKVETLAARPSRAGRKSDCGDWHHARKTKLYQRFADEPVCS